MAVESKKREMTTETKSSLTPKDQLPAKLQAQLGLFIRDLSDEFGKDPEIQKKLEEIAQKIQTSDPLEVVPDGELTDRLGDRIGERHHLLLDPCLESGQVWIPIRKSVGVDHDRSEVLDRSVWF